uniref:Uncharacterized protein n=1 Tax=Amphiprion percula TaxID=161767 RepID=A0A3P8TEQ1_AMPPE
MFPVSPAPETAVTLRGCFQSPPAPYPLPLREKVKFGPSVTDQRAGPSSWWPSTAVKMFSSPNPITCPTYSQSFIDTVHVVCLLLLLPKNNNEVQTSSTHGGGCKRSYCVCVSVKCCKEACFSS